MGGEFWPINQMEVLHQVCCNCIFPRKLETVVFTPLAHLIYGSLLWAFCYTGLPLTAYSLACFVLSRLFPDPLGNSHDPANMGSSAAHRANHATPPDALVWLRSSASLLANNTKCSGLCLAGQCCVPGGETCILRHKYLVSETER